MEVVQLEREVRRGRRRKGKSRHFPQVEEEKGEVAETGKGGSGRRPEELLDRREGDGRKLEDAQFLESFTKGRKYVDVKEGELVVPHLEGNFPQERTPFDERVGPREIVWSPSHSPHLFPRSSEIPSVLIKRQVVRADVDERPNVLREGRVLLKCLEKRHCSLPVPSFEI